MSPFKKVLVANRGEIAVRVIRGCQELGIAAVAIYSEADRDALHVRVADEAYPVGPAPSVESYLNGDAVLQVARRSGVDAIHPGYGFLSERAHFARACESAGFVFVGPPAAAMELLGSKIAAKRLAIETAVPVVPGYDGQDQSPQTLLRAAEQLGFPLLVKASAGGGGKGMRVVGALDEFQAALEGAKREARAAFGDDDVLLERLIDRPRHVEIQVIGDRHGNMIHLGERECSIQRRHQKIVEESPCVVLDESLRTRMGEAATRLARAAGYHNAGTVEFMLDQDKNFYFLEMNTRLQVEHPVTELASGFDLVQLQLRVAAGERLVPRQDEVLLRGHAIEMRIYAEDPVTLLPQVGPVHTVATPEGPGVRNDVGVAGGDQVTMYYDPMIAKLIVHAPDRQSAIGRLRRALDDYAVLGLVTNLPLLRAIAHDPWFARGEIDTGYLERMSFARELVQGAPPFEVLAAAAFFANAQAPAPDDPFATLWRSNGAQRYFQMQAHGTVHPIRMIGDRVIAEAGDGRQPEEAQLLALRGPRVIIATEGRHERIFVAGTADTVFAQWRAVHYRLNVAEGLSVDQLVPASQTAGGASLQAPMSGTVIKVLAAVGQVVSAGMGLVVIEAMKMEHTVVAPYDGRVSKVHVRPGQLAAGGAVLVELDAQSSDNREQSNGP